MIVAVTGASGFIGKNLVRDFEHSGLTVVPLSRRRLAVPEWRESPVLGRDTDPRQWAHAFTGVRVVVHCAARAHVMNENAADPLDAFRRINRDGAAAMAEGAAIAGVKRIVFLSSVKALGEKTAEHFPFQNDDPVAPVDAYALSKAEAEATLTSSAKKFGFDLVVIRPPLVYGPGVGGNIQSLIELIKRGTWLPLGRAHENRRSMISTGNLADAVRAALTAQRAVGATLLVSDGADLSTCDLLHGLATAAGRKARLLAVPPNIVRAVLYLARREALWGRLFGDLRVDIADTCDRLSWRPRLSVGAGFATITAAPVVPRRIG
jgi:nucleoside-diphosphate-sugar epimerase